MDVVVAPMPRFARAHAVLSVRYGSSTTAFPDGTPLPAGLAHFLEHRMFATPEGDAFEAFAARGAGANAWTSFDQTAYVFTGTRAFDENLRTLFGMLESLHGSEADIERERQIIAQEISLYDDDPGWRGYTALLQALYHRHPVRSDIAGTHESIAAIDGEVLARAHATWYRTGNRVLAVAGPVRFSDVMRTVRQVELAAPAGPRVRRQSHAEPPGVHRRRVRLEMPLSRTHVLGGIKDRVPRTVAARTRQHVLSLLALEWLFGDGGLVQDALYDDGVVDESFSASCEMGPDYAFTMISAEVEDAARYERLLRRRFAQALRQDPAADDLERARRRLLGRHVRLFDVPEEVAAYIGGLVLEGESPETAPRALAAATASAVRRRAQALFDAPSSWCTLAP